MIQRRLPGQPMLSAQHPIVPVALSFCSGFVDVICYLGLFHSFTAFITGTLIITCSELFDQDAALWIRVVILATFVVSAAIWVPVVKWMIKAGLPAVRMCLALECLFLALFLMSTVALPITPEFLSLGTLLAAVSATIAMSLQNVAMQMVLDFHIPTTVMTGNFMRFILTIIEKVTGEAESGKPHGSGLKEASAQKAPGGPVASGIPGTSGARRYGRSLAAFIGGAVLGAGCLATIGFWGLALPTLLLGAMALLTRD